MATIVAATCALLTDSPISVKSFASAIRTEQVAIEMVNFYAICIPDATCSLFHANCTCKTFYTNWLAAKIIVAISRATNSASSSSK